MTPTINRFIGALQGLTLDPGAEAGGEVLDIAECLLANGGFVRGEIEAVTRTFATEERGGAAPLWRAIPFGLLYFDDLEKLQENTEKACRLTHGSPADIAAAIGMALSLARLLRLTELEPHLFVRDIAWFLRRIDQEAYGRMADLPHILRGEVPFVCGDLSSSVEIFRAALFLFGSCQEGDLERGAQIHNLAATPALPLAYSLAGSFGLLCRLEKPSLRVVMIGEAFHRFADGGRTLPAP